MTGPNNPDFVDLLPVKLAEVKAGDKLVIDDGFTCRGPGEVEIKSGDYGFYFDCAAHLCDDETVPHERGTDAQVPVEHLTHKHYLDGQIANDGETLVGLARPVLTQAAILARLNTGESYAEGTPLEAAILDHCRVTGRDIEWSDANGNVTCFGDAEGRAQ